MLEAKDTLLLDQDSYLNRIADIKETLKKSEDTIKEFGKWMNEFKENSKKLGDIIVQLENQNKGLVWEEVEEKPEIPNTTYND